MELETDDTMDETIQTINDPSGADLAETLSRLHEAWARPDFQAAARQHARGKLTVREKIACLFDAGTFTEEDAPSADLDPRHGERRLLTGCGDMNGRPVAVAIFNSAIAAGAVTISTGDKLIKHMQLAEQRRCPCSSTGIPAAPTSTTAWPRWTSSARFSRRSTSSPAAFPCCPSCPG